MGTLEFQTVLFNFHDVILLMTAMQCLFCFLLLSATAFRNNISIKHKCTHEDKYKSPQICIFLKVWKIVKNLEKYFDIFLDVLAN